VLEQVGDAELGARLMGHEGAVERREREARKAIGWRGSQRGSVDAMNLQSGICSEEATSTSVS
jgi:hypothetical protein